MKKGRIVFLAGEKVVLRPLIKGDMDKILIWLNDPEVTQYLRRNHPLYEKEEEEWFERLGRQKQTDIVFAIETRKGEHIGNVGIHQISLTDRVGTIGIFLGEKKYWGK